MGYVRFECLEERSILFKVCTEFQLIVKYHNLENFGSKWSMGYGEDRNREISYNQFREVE